MKTIVILGLVAGLLTAAPAFAAADTDALCGPGGSEVHQRPGGYCEMLLRNGSLSLPGTNAAEGVLPPDEEEECLCAEAV
jgi:hypothetical protein